MKPRPHLSSKKVRVKARSASTPRYCIRQIEGEDVAASSQAPRDSVPKSEKLFGQFSVDSGEGVQNHRDRPALFIVGERRSGCNGLVGGGNHPAALVRREDSVHFDLGRCLRTSSAQIDSKRDSQGQRAFLHRTWAADILSPPGRPDSWLRGAVRVLMDGLSSQSRSKPRRLGEQKTKALIRPGRVFQCRPFAAPRHRRIAALYGLYSRLAGSLYDRGIIGAGHPYESDLGLRLPTTRTRESREITRNRMWMACPLVRRADTPAR